MASEPLLRPFDFAEHVIRPWTTDLSMTVWIVGMGILVAVACAVLGCFLILRGKALLGDAISHALLAGLAGAFLLTGSRGPLVMVLGAVVAGVVTVVLIEAIHRHSRVKEDASMAVVFSALFALGVVLITRYTEGVDLDAQCVLYGEIETSWLRTQRVWMMAVVTTLVVLGVVLFFKELKITTFDPATATAVGIPAGLVHYALMTGVSVTIVSGMEAVGVILVVSMLIAPGATAYLLTDNLRRMLWIASACGALAALLGYHMALWLDCSTAGAMAVIATAQFGVALLASPLHGVVIRAARRHQLAVKIARENVLRAIFQMQPVPASCEPVSSRDLGDRLRVLPAGLDRTCRRMQRHGWLTRDGAQLQLTDRGQSLARRIVRAHRLWETFLVDQMGVASDHVHPDAEEIEHLLGERLLNRLDDLLDHPTQDPHGKGIPRNVDVLVAGMTTPLSNLRHGDVARIIGFRSAAPGGIADRVASMGLPLGADLVLRSRTEDGKWTVRLPNGREQAIEHELADAILMELRVPGVESA